MSTCKLDPILKLFHVACVITTIALVGWCIKQYSLDYDYTETTFATFHQTEDDIYPSITICNMSPYLEEKVYEHFSNLPIEWKGGPKSIHTSYKNFLDGTNISATVKSDWLRLMNITYDQMLNILLHVDYDEITANLDDLLTSFYITFPLYGRAPGVVNYRIDDGSLVA